MRDYTTEFRDTSIQQAFQDRRPFDREPELASSNRDCEAMVNTLGALHEQCDRVAAAIDGLESRLSGILRPPQPEACEPGPAVPLPAISPVRNGIHAATDKLASLTKAIERLERRVDL